MKRDRHGKGKILSQEEIQLLFSQGLTNVRDRCLFAIMMFTAIRVNEACTLLSEDVYDKAGRVRSHLTIRKKNTKRKLATRTLPIISELYQLGLTMAQLVKALYQIGHPGCQDAQSYKN